VRHTAPFYGALNKAGYNFAVMVAPIQEYGISAPMPVPSQ
jgi:hypothetical protein